MKAAGRAEPARRADPPGAAARPARAARREPEAHRAALAAAASEPEAARAATAARAAALAADARARAAAGAPQATRAPREPAEHPEPAVPRRPAAPPEPAAARRPAERPAPAGPPARGALIHNDTFWKDTSGTPIYSQGGGVFTFNGTYYWYGVKYNGAVSYAANTKKNSDTSFAAITCYSSTDLVTWKHENDVLTTASLGANVDSGTWIGRMGVVYNATTKKYVLISQYQAVRRGPASSSPPATRPRGRSPSITFRPWSPTSPT